MPELHARSWQKTGGMFILLLTEPDSRAEALGREGIMVKLALSNGCRQSFAEADSCR